MTAARAITAVATNLRSHPLAFALVLVNVLFIGAGVWVLRDVAINARERAEAMNLLLAQCVAQQLKPEKK